MINLVIIRVIIKILLDNTINISLRQEITYFI